MIASITWKRRERPISHGRFIKWRQIPYLLAWDGLCDRGPYRVHEATLCQHVGNIRDIELANDLGECFYENWPGIESFRAHHSGVSSASAASPWPAGFERLPHMRPDITVDWRPSTDSDAVPGATYNPRTSSIAFAGREYNCSPPDEHGVITFTVPAEDREVVQALQGKSVSVDCDLPTVPIDPHWQESLSDMMRRLRQKHRPVLLENDPAWVADYLARDYAPTHPVIHRPQDIELQERLRDAWQRPERQSPTLRERYCSCTMRNTCVDAMPHMHARDCPVAPVPGLHGGMREEVASDGWQYNDVAKKWIHGRRRVQFRDWELSDLSRVSATWPREFDAMLGAFYLPPAQPDATPASLPVDSDPEMETVAARATQEPERWKMVQR